MQQLKFKLLLEQQLKTFMRKKIFPAMLMFLLTLNLTAQTYEEARKIAFDGDYSKARNICRQILASDFNSDVALLLGRTFAWEGMYDSARVVLIDVLERKPGNEEALDALSDVEFWADNYEKAVEYCNEAITNNISPEKFVLKKARILHSNKKYDEAVNTLKDYMDKNPVQPELIRKLREYRPDVLKNSIRLTYTVDFFDKEFNRDPWQITSLAYGRKTKAGTFIARLNYASRFETNGFQFEADAYPKLGENSYGYLNYGFSQNSLFPDHRFGAEWYRNFPKAFEGSAGIRLLGFGSSFTDIYTATIGKYTGNYWLSLRTYVTPDQEGTSLSGALSVRRYFADAENYVGLRLGYGISPDDNRNQIGSEKALTIKTRSIRAEFNHIFKRSWILNTGAVVGGEEIQPGEFSGYYTFDISIVRLF
jgi:YaiO family outer membrane protein